MRAGLQLSVKILTFIFILCLHTQIGSADGSTRPAPIGTINISENSPVRRGQYILPNEQHPQSFAPALKSKTGTLVSVGTFRTLFDASFGNFDNVVFADYDSLTTDFNKAHLNAIASSADRYEYLASFSGRKASGTLLEEARSGRITDKEYMESLLKSRRVPETELPQGFQKLFSIMQRAVGVGGPWGIKGPLKLEQVLSNAVEKPESFSKTYLLSNEAFNRIKKGITEGRYQALDIDLAGTSMIELGEELHKKNARISALDLSNAMEHIKHLPKNFKSFVKNIQNLPFENDAKVLFTLDSRLMSRPLGKVSEDSWFYRSMDISNFEQAIKKPYKEFAVMAAGVDDSFLKAALRDLSSTNFETETGAAEALSQYGPWSETFWDFMGKFLNEPHDKHLQWKLVNALESQSEWPDAFWEKYVPGLINNPVYRERILDRLKEKKTWPDAIWKKIPHLMQSTHPWERDTIALALAKQPRWPDEIWKQIYKLRDSVDDELTGGPRDKLNAAIKRHASRKAQCLLDRLGRD